MVVAIGLGALLIVLMSPFLGWPLAFLAATFLFNDIRRRLNKSVVWEDVEKECARRSSCVYLRSFWDDDLGFGPDLFWPGIWVLRPPRRRLEEVVVRSIWPYHAVVAVGEAMRGESESPTEAFRAPADNANWQSVVAELTRSANLVVLLAGHSPGLQWEHGHLRSENALTRTLVLLPPGTRGDRRDRWEALLRTGYFQSESDDSYEPSAPDRHNILFREQKRFSLGDFRKRAAGRLDRMDADFRQRIGGRSAMDELVDRTIACIWDDEGRRIHFTSRIRTRSAYELTLRLACAPLDEVLKLSARS